MIGVLVLNVIGWPLIHIAVSKLAFRRELSSFNPQSALFRERSFEVGGRFYERFLRIKSWKRLLPDGAALLGQGFRKKNLQSRKREYLEEFYRETCRGEWAHWVTLSAAPLFFLWNPLWADVVMLSYALVANLPCILVQRYNRLTLARLLSLV
jgi:glycosyl-4,4'-diaponeurosporenoate acyltransferase